RWHVKTQRLGGLEVDPPARIWSGSHWQISRFLIAQDAVTVARGLPEQLGDVNNAHHASILFRPMMPARMSARNVSRRTDTLSPSAIMPAIARRIRGSSGLKLQAGIAC